MFKKKNFRERRSDYMDRLNYDSDATPQKEGEPQVGLSILANKNLNHSTFSITADPYAATNTTSRPYNILARFLKKVGGLYKGNRNLDGGNVQQYANSNMSLFLSCFDYFRMKMQWCYRLRPVIRPTDVETENTTNGTRDLPYTGSGLIDQCIQAIAEAASVLQSTTFTQMAINHYVIETDMAMGGAERVTVNYATGFDDNLGRTSVEAYRDISSVLYATLNYYQIILNDILNLFNWYNSFRLKQGTMIRNSWNRETPALNSLFSLLNKKSFLGLMDSIAMAFPGEYVDKDWATQINLLNAMPSRRSDAMTDPVLELQTRALTPTIFRMYYTDEQGNIIAKIFDASLDFTKKFYDAQQGQESTKTLSDAIEEIEDYLSAENIALWARRNVVISGEADNAYYNEVKYRLDVVQLCITTFKNAFCDVREALDTLSRTGIITWTKGFRPSITKNTDAELFDNQLVNDIFVMTFSGSTNVNFDPDTKRWRTYSIWNMYNGIPEYDAKSGGIFLTLSAKKFNASEDSDGTFKFLPVMFRYDDTVIGGTAEGVHFLACSRNGVEILGKSIEKQLSTEPVYKRLTPLPSQSGLVNRIPTYFSRTGTITDGHKSMLYKTLTQVFGFSAMPKGDDQYDFALDPDIIAVYQIELEDITNMAIAYARATGPFRGSVDFKDEIGFASFGTGR